MDGEITLEMLQQTVDMFEEKMKSFPRVPNPADVTPELWKALKSRCVTVKDKPIDIFGSIEIHIRTDVPNWQLNECTCEKEKHAATSGTSSNREV